MLHICLCMHDRTGAHAKYAGVTIASLLEHTGSEVTFHLFHDDSLRNEDKERFLSLVSRYQQRMLFYPVKLPDDFSRLKVLKKITIGTLYRLLIPDLLDPSIGKVIYLDTDLVVLKDIASLWEKETGAAYAIAVRDYGVVNMAQSVLFTSGKLSHESYFNDGVIILNLERIRKDMNLYQAAVQFFRQYADVLDSATQHALNYLFRGNVLFMEPENNFFTRLARKQFIDQRGRIRYLPPLYTEVLNGKTDSILKNGILHFAGDYPRAAMIDSFDTAFFQCLCRTPWGEPDTLSDYFSKIVRFSERQLRALRLASSIPPDRIVVYFGVNGYFSDSINKYVRHIPDAENDYVVDNNPKLWGQRADGLMVYSPERLRECAEKPYIIVRSKNYYEEIYEQLISYGYEEFTDFMDGILLLPEEEGGRSVRKDEGAFERFSAG